MSIVFNLTFYNLLSIEETIRDAKKYLSIASALQANLNPFSIEDKKMSKNDFVFAIFLSAMLIIFGVSGLFFEAFSQELTQNKSFIDEPYEWTTHTFSNITYGVVYPTGTLVGLDVTTQHTFIINHNTFNRKTQTFSLDHTEKHLLNSTSKTLFACSDASFVMQYAIDNFDTVYILEGSYTIDKTVYINNSTKICFTNCFFNGTASPYFYAYIDVPIRNQEGQVR